MQLKVEQYILIMIYQILKSVPLSSTIVQKMVVQYTSTVKSITLQLLALLKKMLLKELEGQYMSVDSQETVIIPLNSMKIKEDKQVEEQYFSLTWLKTTLLKALLPTITHFMVVQSFSTKMQTTINLTLTSHPM